MSVLAAVAADPDRLRALARVGADANERLRTAATHVLAAADDVAATADPRLDRAPVLAAIAEVERTLGGLASTYDALDREVSRFADALESLDGTGLPGGLRVTSARMLDLLMAARAGAATDPRRHEALGLKARLDGLPPDQVAGVLRGTAPEVATRLAELAPVLVGGLDGAPGWLRGHANRLLLDVEVSRLERELDRLDRERDALTLGPGHRGRRSVLDRRRAELLDRLDRLEVLAARPDVRLLVFDAARGRIAATTGDVDTADHVATLVPGTGASIDGFDGYLARADDLSSLARAADPRGDTAVVAWLDYDAPPTLVHATSAARARDAATDLASFSAGIAALNPDATRTLLGHSYGSTVVGATARKHDLDVDAIVGVGSPGMRAGTADEFRLPDDGRIYAVTDTSGGKLNPFSGDYIHTVSDGLATARLGRDPVRGGFGADSFDVADAGGHGLAGYLDPESVSGRNFGRLVTGDHAGLDR